MKKEGEKDHMYVIGEKKKIPHLIKVNLIYSYSSKSANPTHRLKGFLLLFFS
jgi:hypothetical protein